MLTAVCAESEVPVGATSGGDARARAPPVRQTLKKSLRALPKRHVGVVDVTMADDEIRLVLAPTHPGGPDVKLYISPDFTDEIFQLAEAEGLVLTEGIEHSQGADLVLYIVHILGGVGGLAGLAAVLNALFSRHQHKKMTVEVGDEVVSVEGMSQPEAEATLSRLLEKVNEQQRMLDESWKRVEEEARES